MPRLRWTLLTFGLIAVGVGAVAAQVARPVPAVLLTTVEAIGRPANVDPLRIVERLMSFDADLDDRISREELPERMQALIGRADKDGDGFLNQDEIRAAQNELSPARGVVRSRTAPDVGLPEVISDLRLPEAKHERALGLVRASKLPHTRNDPASVDLYARMRELLDDEEYENFVAAAERRSIRVVIHHEFRAAPPPPPPPR